MVHDLNGDIMVSLLISSILGGVIGLEREVHGRPAGFRTHLLVSLGSCLFVISSIYIYRLYGNFNGVSPVGVDPARIAAQVVTGIGFLGAGAIIQEKASIRGLTTAACLWLAAAIGLACGVGMYLTALSVTLLSLLSLLLLKKVEKVLNRDSYSRIKVWGKDMPGLKENLEQALMGNNLRIVGITVEKDYEAGDIFFDFEINYRTREYAVGLIDLMGTIEGVKRLRIG